MHTKVLYNVQHSKIFCGKILSILNLISTIGNFPRGQVCKILAAQGSMH